MNNATVKAELGAHPDLQFASCNMDIAQGFLFQVSEVEGSERISLMRTNELGET